MSSPSISGTSRSVKPINRITIMANYCSNSRSSQTRAVTPPTTITSKKTLTQSLHRTRSKISINLTTIHGKTNGIRAIRIIPTMGTRMAGIVWRTVKVIWGPQARAHRGIMDMKIQIRVAGMTICGNGRESLAKRRSAASVPLPWTFSSWRGRRAVRLHLPFCII
jgi:hypothetical protein